MPERLNAILFVGMLLLLAGCEQKEDSQADNSLTLLPDKIISPADDFIGGGVEWSAYPHADSENAEWGLLMTDQKWQEVFKRLDFMQPKIVRVLDQANWRYLEGMDDNGNPIVNFDNQEMQALYKLLDYCEKNEVQVILGEWGQPYKVHDPKLQLQNAFSGTSDSKWISIIVEHINHLVHTKGYTCIRYFNLVNEPNGYWSSVDGNWEEWKNAVTKLDSAFKSSDIKQVKVMGPDSTPYNNEKSKFEGMEWPKQAVLQLNDVLGAYDVHDYPTVEKVRSGKFQEDYTKLISFADSVAHKTFVLGEVGFEKYVEPNITRYKEDPHASPDSQMRVYDYDYGVDMADVMAQSLNAGFDGVIAWGLDDAMHTNGDSGDTTQLKRWGMWNILGEELTGDPSDKAIRPWFYTWSLMTRFYKGDMDILRIQGSLPEGIRSVAGKSANGNCTLTLVNNSGQQVSLSINGKSFSTKEQSFQRYLYSENERPVDPDGFPVPLERNISMLKSHSVTIPARSVMLFTTYTN